MKRDAISSTEAQLRSLLAQRILILDGAMGTSIHACADCAPADYLGRDNCTDILVKSRPDIIQRIHENYFAAGADVVEELGGERASPCGDERVDIEQQGDGEGAGAS